VDRAGNPTTRTFRLHRDAAPPEVWTEVPPRVTTTTVPLAWGARDTGAGVRGYDVALRVDDGPWQPVLTQTQRTAHTFTDLPGEVFTFRVIATDNGRGPTGSPGQFRRSRNCYLDFNESECRHRAQGRAGECVEGHVQSITITADSAWRSAEARRRVRTSSPSCTRTTSAARRWRRTPRGKSWRGGGTTRTARSAGARASG
jgi:hypothetical protein